MLGWDIDTVSVTISVPLEKLERLRNTLNTGANGRRVMLGSVDGQFIRQSVTPSSDRAYTSGLRSWAAFRGLIGEVEYLDAAVSETEGVDRVRSIVCVGGESSRYYRE